MTQGNNSKKLPVELITSFKSLKETSYDKKNNEYMTDSNLMVVDFDNVKDIYVKNNLNNITQNPKSNDALYITNTGRWVFIEFKNGEINDITNFGLNKKIYDSLFILFDIMFNNSVNFKSCISYTRENMDYILVYNGDKYNEKRETALTKQGKKRQNISLQNSKSRDILKKSLSNLAGEEFILFGLDQFKGYFFKNVYTFTKEEFEEKFVNKYARQG